MWRTIAIVEGILLCWAVLYGVNRALKLRETRQLLVACTIAYITVSEAEK